MKCVNCIHLLSSYVDGEVSFDDKMAIETHLLSCPECRSLLAELQEEDEVLTKVLTRPTLPDDFTESFMNRLVATMETESSFQPETHHESKPKPSKIRWRNVVVSSVATIVLAFAIGMYVSPTFAAYISSFLKRDGGELGVKRAAEQGYSAPINVAVSDQNYTLRIKDIVADPTRLVVSYLIEDKNGKQVMDLFIPWWGENDIYITDSANNELARSPTFSRGGDYADFIFDLDNPPDQLVVHFDIREFGQPGKPVNWKLSVPVDISASRSSTKTIPIEAEYISPQNVAFNLQQVTYAPSATRLELITARTLTSKSEISQVAEKLFSEPVDQELLDQYVNGYAFSYHLENAHGEIVAKSTDTRYNREAGNLYVKQAVYEADRQKWHGSYVLKDPSEPVFFVLNEIRVVEPVRVPIEFDPEKVAAHPVTKQMEGNQYTVQKAEKTIDPKTKETVWAVTIVVKQPERISGLNRWKAFDQDGKEYQTEPDYEKYDGKKETVLIRGMTKDPKKMTLMLLTLKKAYKVNWKVPIPPSSGSSSKE